MADETRPRKGSGQWRGADRAGLCFGVLGPVRVCRDGELLDVGSPQRRALLAALLLRRGRTATAPELISDLWGPQPPDAAIAALRNHASRLRKTLGADSNVLVSELGGYALRVAADALDLDRAKKLWLLAKRASGADDRLRARDLIAQALDIWHGEALAGVPGPYAEAQRTRLEEWRLSLLESRLELDVETGHPGDIVAELTALTSAHPLRERLRELLMLALYRSGRQAEALAVYADARRLLAQELGVEPRTELSELQQRILRADAALSPPATDSAAAYLVTAVRPAQLPAAAADFTGRVRLVAELTDHLSTADGRVMPVSAVAGIGGVGKTTLAVQVAHAVRSHFPDGQLYVDLRGTDPTAAAEPETVLASFLRALGIPDEAIPADAEERAALYRTALAGRRVLTLLDNARDASQVRPLLPGTEGCAALITSRARLALAGARLVDLEVTTPEESLTLFTRIVGHDRVSVEQDAAREVVTACGRLPLAIRIAASRLCARRTWTVAVLAARLSDERRRLDELRAGDLAVAASFELGYSQLDPRQARAFCLLGLPDAPDISLPAAAALLDMGAADAERLIESLVDASLLETAAPGRYRFHDLVRLYARARADRDQPPAQREGALSRLLDFYLASAAGVYALTRPGDRLVAHLARTDHDGLVFDGQEAALDWLFPEVHCLLTTIHQSLNDSMRHRACDLLLVIKDLAESGAASRSYQLAVRACRDAARAAHDARAEGRACLLLSQCCRIASKYDEADSWAAQALELAATAGDPVPLCEAHTERGIVALPQGRCIDAVAHFEAALAAFSADGNRPGVAGSLSNISRVYAATGRAESAVTLAAKAVALYEDTGMALRLANGWYALGLALCQAGRHAEALAYLTRALDRFKQNRQRLWEGSTHARLAEVYLATQRPADAAHHAERSLELRSVGGEQRRATVLTVLGKALAAMGQIDRARACWGEALAVHQRLGTPERLEVSRLLA
ncbi:AfsR/SARP family transcriptional regulator [Streptomyces zagrosensis]|uniref:DNA-binding SARP family transcriptional activator n=1 Tax=Streptomyces zagrosensis TaxID=1042984 RepID=A0A7W9V212_9ACTN|nr:BTAD domain-containing putative transcriptional regulator [Streptomyces zagrosensis]MBB5939858.1 DNA-binding SARP family transcriptional activator [Streptomyces zagrosensis]